MTSSNTDADQQRSSDNPVAEPAPAGKKRMKRSSRIAFTIIAILAIIAALGFSGTYFFYSRNYVSTDNAQVDGDKISINAPAPGIVTSWTINNGSRVRTNEVVGRIKLLNSFAQPQRAIKSPGDGTIAVNNIVDGQYVTPGTELATAYDFSKIYLTARVDETDVDDVHVGAQVDFTTDAFPGVPMSGLVLDVQGSSAGTFAQFPQNNSSGNFQKVTQLIPVKISLLDTGGQQLSPGMNVTVHIHKH